MPLDALQIASIGDTTIHMEGKFASNRALMKLFVVVSNTMFVDLFCIANTKDTGVEEVNSLAF